MTDCLLTEVDSFSTFPQLSVATTRWKSFKIIHGEVVFTLRWWSVAGDGCASFKEIDGQVQKRKRNCFNFAMMICCRWWISVLQGHFGTGREPPGCARFAEILSELTKTWSSGATECGVWIGNCNVKVWKSTEHKLHKIWRSLKFQQNEHTPGETVCTLRWWSVAADGSPSFKDTSGQVENKRRNFLYFAMMMCCCWWISVLQGYLGTGREPKEKMFLLCDDDPFLKTYGFIYLLKLVVVRLHIRINFKNYDTSFFCFVLDFLIW